MGTASSVHSHTFEISLYVTALRPGFEAYDETENHVREYLSKYSGKIIDRIEPFNETEPTVEHIGEVFFSDLGSVLERSGFLLNRLDIRENPNRTYTINKEKMSEEKRLAMEASIQKILNVKQAVPLPAKQDSIPISTPDTEPSVDLITESESLPQVSGRLLGSSRWNSIPVYTLMAVALALIGAFIALQVRASGLYPLGMDIHGHLFKSDLMYREIGKGNLFPLYTQYWYNGVQPFRYWPPLPYYFMALLQFLGGGDVMNAYLMFIWLSFTVGSIGWLLFARKLQRPFLGFFCSVIWFLLPDNLRVFFGEGNLPRMFIAMFLPYIFFFLWQFVCYKKKNAIIPLVCLMPVVIMGHLMISAMIGVASAIFLLIYSIANKRFKESAQALFAMFFTFAVCGIWVYPSLQGGITAMSSDATSSMVALVSEKLSVSLNPFLRTEGGIATLYVGLAIFIVSGVGLFLSNRKSFPGFATFIIFVLGTSASLAALIVELPLSQYFWVRRFIPIAYVLFLISLLEWKSLKKVLLILMCFWIAFDSIPSLFLDEFDKRMNIPATHGVIATSMDDYLFAEAKSVTKQRVSLMDLSMFGPMPSYAFCSLTPETQYVFGWAWQASSTAMNIAYLNEALEKRNFLYMFDRNLELGADTILIDKTQVAGDEAVQQMFATAKQTGYDFVSESDRSWLFSYPVDSTFGVITDYSCLAIGTTAALVPGILPYYHPGDKLVIDDYSFEELSKYEKIYLSGFFYNNRVVAEQLVREIADAGVEVFIDMSRIPADPLTNRMTFLSVDAQPITFTYSYPNLVTEGGVIRPKPFAEDYNTWNTVYLNGLTEATGYAWFENSPRLDFIGTAGSENVIFIGFNLLFHAYMAADADVKEILNSEMDLQENNLPDRKIIPITIEYGKNTITIQSEFDNVNTTLAYQDIFESDQPIRSMNNLLIIDSGTTEIKMSYPHLAEGVAVTLIGILAEIATIILIFRKSKKKPHTGLKI